MNPLFHTLAICLVASFAAHAGVVVQGQNSTTALAYGTDVKTDDLINTGQPTLSSASVSASNANFPGTGINDGGYSNTSSANTFFQYDIHFPASATYQLNLASAPNGYDISSITSLMGWFNNSPVQANQNYTVEVSVVGSAGFRPLAHVNYAFPGSGSIYESKVVVRDDTSVPIACNVDAIRFIFADPGNSGTNPGTVVREIDVIGSASATAAPAVTVQTVSDFSETNNAYAGEVLNNDLVNSGQATLASFISSTTPSFAVGGSNDGLSNLANSGVVAWYRPAQTPAQLPATLTFNLNTSASPDGFVVTSIRTFAGWTAGGTQSHANQKYAVEYQNVGSSTWLPLESVDFSPFNSLVDTHDNTRVVLSAPTGNLLTGVAAVRFILQEPTRAPGANNGTVLQEIDVVGYPVSGVAITSPTPRFLAQRNASNTGTIPVTGYCPVASDRIEARAVVMAGPNSGTTTDWQTIASQPAGNSFAGNLTNVPAGGWYRLEVRSVTGETPSAVATVDKIGVGDIYLTAGQSNSANHGAPGYTPTDDRVSVRTTVSGASWRHGYDPVPIATGTGGSAWSRLGDLLAAADNIPVGFLCVGVGGTRLDQWQPGQANYDTLLKPALQSLPSGGFRAVLWHQGESDSIANVTAVAHRDMLNTMITRSRQDAGWAVPWYVAEVSFTPNTKLSQEEPVVAGQRMAVFADANVFLGPTTDSFHLEDANGGKLSDGIHFNGAGLLDHATQWRDILRGTASLAPRNGDFEENRNPAVTGLSPLADGGIHTINATGDNDSPGVLGWRVLNAANNGAADGTNGYWNPDATYYPNAADIVNGGVAANMSGKHVAFLFDGSAGNHFLHTRRASVTANTTYTLNVAIGVRIGAQTFGGAAIELLADGNVIASRTVDLAGLNALNVGNAAGTFTDIALTATTGPSIAPGQPLAIRIRKTGGASTYLDFDNVRLTSTEVSVPNQTWNTNGATDSWNAADLNWDAGVAWTDGNNALFAGSGEAITVNTVAANSLTFTGSDYSLSGGTIVLNNLGSGIDVGSGLSTTIGSSIAGSTGMAKTGAGTLVLTGTNTYSGTTFVSAGALEIGGAGTLGSGNHAGAISNSGTLRFNSSAAQTLAGAVSGTGNLIKQGASILTLTGSNAYTGTTTINNGTLQLGNGTIQPTINSAYDIASGATLKIQYNTTTGSAAQTWSKYTGAGALVLATGKNFDFGWGQGGLGATFTGTLQIEGGRVFTGVGGVGLGNTSQVVVKSGGQLGMWEGGTFSQNFTITGTGYGETNYEAALRLANDSTRNNTLTGTITLAGDATIGAASTGVATINNPIGQTTASGLTVGTASLNGTVVFQGTNTYTGTTTVRNGVLSLNASAPTVLGNLQMTGGDGTYLRTQQANQFAPGVIANFTSAWGAWNRFEFFGKNQTFAGINTGTLTTQGGGIFQNSEANGAAGAVATLTLNVSGAGPYVFNGHVRDYGSPNAGTHPLSLIKNGTGTQTLVGSVVSYSGTTTINSGTLELISTGAFKSPTTITSGTTLKLGNSGDTGTPTAFTVALNSGGTLTHDGQSTNHFWVIGGAVTNTGSTTINQHSIAAGATSKSLFLDGGLKGTGTVTINATNAGNGVVCRNNNTTFSGNLIVNGIADADVNEGSGIGVGGCTTGLQNTDIQLNGTMELLNQGVGWAGTASGVFQMGALSGTGVMVGNFTGGGGTTVTVGNTNNHGSFSGVIANGAGNTVHLVKVGTGTQTLSGANLTYSGTTAINNGTLLIDGTKSGNGAVTVNANGTLGGTGSVSGALTVNANGTMAPGTTGTGTLTTGATTIAGTYTCQLDGAACDKLAVTGNLNLTGSTLAVSSINNAPSATSYLIATYTGTLTGTPTVTGLPGYVVDTSTTGQIKLVGNPAYSSWAASNGLTGANGGKMQDPDVDNSNNLMEFAFGTNPLTPSSGILTYSGGVLTSHGQPTTSITNLPNGVDYRAVFCRRKDYLSAGLTYTVQFSVDFTTWVNSTATPTVVASDAEFDAVSVPYPLFIPTANGVEKPTFFRVAVTSNP